MISLNSMEDPNMKTTIYFIRHAQSQRSAAVKNSQWPLSPQGKSQAEKLSSLLSHLRVTDVISSPYLRCVETVNPFVEKSEVNFSTVEGLRERHLANGLIKNFEEVWEKSWGDFDFKLEGCESSREAQIRIRNTVDCIVQDYLGKTIAISTHGFVLGLFLNSIDPENGRKVAAAIKNPDVKKIDFCGGEFLWDRGFSLTGLDEITTFNHESPEVH